MRLSRSSLSFNLIWCGIWWGRGCARTQKRTMLGILFHYSPSYSYENNSKQTSGRPTTEARLTAANP